MTLPAYISGVPDISDRAVSGIGTALPPHVSIRGNKFTLVDAAGNKKLLGDTMDFLVADLGDHLGKMYYPEKWNKDSDDPPTCWSANGIGPSRDAITPQARTCAECQWNVRGSKISETGASVKACRDEIYTAIVHPQFPGMLFQFKITPGSFKNWRKHVEECKNIPNAQGAHVGVIITHAEFEAESSGTITFKAVSYPDQATWDARTKAVTSKATDLLVGRLDRPRELAAPAQTSTAQLTPPAQQTNIVPAGETTAFGNPTPAAQAEPETQRRKRRTKAEIEADNAKQQGGAAFGGGQQMAPFRPEAAPAAQQPNGQAGGQFGIATNPPGPSADIQASLDAAFGKPSDAGGFGR